MDKYQLADGYGRDGGINILTLIPISKSKQAHSEGRAFEVFEDKNIHEDELAVILSELKNHLTVTDIILDVYSTYVIYLVDGGREDIYLGTCACTGSAENIPVARTFNLDFMSLWRSL